MSENVSLSPAQVRKNRLMLMLLLATFVVPFVIGDLAYRHGWYKGGQTNHGQLITPPVSFAGFKARNAAGQLQAATFAKESWWLLYVMPARCDAACHNRLFQMRQVRKALGKESDRVHSVLVLTAVPDQETEALLQREFPDFVRLSASAQDVDASLASVKAGASSAGLLYIMDPMAWIMMSYDPEPDEKTSVVKAEDILNDLKKLLKASRIG